MQRRFRTAWQNAPKANKHSLMLTTFAAVKWELLISSIPRLTIIGFKYAQPFLKQTTISYVSDRKNQPEDIGLGLVAAYALVYTGLAILTASYTHLSNRVVVRIRGGLVTLIYGHPTELSITALNESSALTLMSSDVQSITESLASVSEIYGSLIEVGIAMVLLYKQLGLAFAAPGVVMLVAALGTAIIAYVVPRYQEAWVSAIQTRVSFTANLLSSIRPIKLLGL
jgi:ATP-binding cassette subfamily C (CFTR/MRP) protein 1